MTVVKRFLRIAFALLIAGTVTLALIPHYTCACGEVKKADGSQLTILAKEIFTIAVDVLRPLTR